MNADSVSESKFNKWRAIVAIAHADGIVRNEEADFIQGYLERVPFSLEQKQELQKELSDGANIDEIIPLITDPADRAQVVHFARVLCYRDGDFHPNEEKLIHKLHSHAMSQADIRGMKTQLNAIESAYEVDKEAEREKLGPIQRFFSSLKD